MIDAYQGLFVTKCALRLAPLVFVRPGELRKAQWSEIDLDEAEWRIPAARMKMREQHIVPLSRQAVQILRELEPLTGRPIEAKPEAPLYVFPSGRSRQRPMSENAVLAALRRMGYAKEEMTGHGFRMNITVPAVEGASSQRGMAIIDYSSSDRSRGLTAACVLNSWRHASLKLSNGSNPRFLMLSASS